MRKFHFLAMACGLVLLLGGCGSSNGVPYSPSGNTSYPLVGQWGGGYTHNPMSPEQIWIHNSTLFVADDDDEVIQKFDLDGTYLGGWSAPVSSDLGGVAVDSQGHVFVGDDSVGYVFEYDLGGNLLNTWTAGTAGLNASFGAWNVYVDDSDNVFVVDYQGCGCVVELPKGASTWNTGSTGYLGDGYSVTKGHDGMLYVPDHTTGLIHIVNSSLVDTGTVPNVGPSGPTTLAGPSGIVTDSDGNLLVCTNRNPVNIVKMTTGGAFLQQMTNPSFQSLESVALDASGNLYAGDDRATMIFKFAHR